MMDRNALWMWLSLAEGVGPVTVNDIWAALSEREMGLEDFFALGENEWAADFQLNRRAVGGLAEAKTRIEEIAALLELLAHKGCWLLPLDSPQYPGALREALRRNTPPVLYGVGNAALLERVGVAVVGARDTSERGLAIARRLGGQVARHGLVLVSGGARGTDAAAHVGALEAGGETIVVLSCGILRFRSPRGLAEAADPNSTLYLSELPPNKTWDVGGAMQRNRIVCALASAVVVVEAAESGGTIQAARSAMQLGRPVFAVACERPDDNPAGNRILLRQGARALPFELDASSSLAQIDLAPVAKAIDKRDDQGAGPQQPDLFSS